MIEQQDISAEARAAMRALYGENKQITDDNYDKSLAVKCVNGTFVGKKKDNVIAYKGIPFVGKQPVGEQRWKAPVDFVPDEGIYEAYYYGKSPFHITMGKVPFRPMATPVPFTLWVRTACT